MAKSATRLITTIDFDAPGKQCDFIRLPHSVHRSAYGWLPLPIVSIKHGTGPTAVLMSGTHGDEYEGQVALCRLAAALEPEHIQGRVIIFPMANYPAAKAGLRTSPIDDLNLNRVFPGDPAGSPTQAIADYIETVLMDLADFSLDLHSGGSSLMYLPMAIISSGDTEEDTQFRRRLGSVFGAPYALSLPGSHAAGNSSGAALRNGVISMGTEVGGSGTVTHAYAKICEEGVRRVLGEIGILKSGVPPVPDTPTRILTAPDFSYFCYASEDGLFDPLVELGDTVAKGDLAGRIYTPETPWRAPAEVFFEQAGLVVCKRIPGRVERGDCLFHLGADI